jgi:hydroxyacylglutathione hydrolase
MLFRRLYDDDLAQASYLIGCETCGEAVVVDPMLDVGRYFDAAREEGLTIKHVTETHIHADFVSGSRELARLADARLYLSGEGGPDWQYSAPGDDEPAPWESGRGSERVTRLQDGDLIALGMVRLTALHTPGHTPEHLSFLVTDTAVSEQPVGLLSGDFIFVGDVGRPDLLERAANMAGTMRASARVLYASLQRAKALPDHLQLWPGHGAGSACGKALGAMPQSTVGYERLVNPGFAAPTEDAFVAEVLSAQPEPPRYFARMKTVNRDGHPAPVSGTAMAVLSPARVDEAVAAGALVIDTRLSAAFKEAFVPGTICVPKSKSFTTYFGAVAPNECPVVLLVATEADARAIGLRLHYIGFDRIAGFALAREVIDARRAGGLPIGTIEIADLGTVRRLLASPQPPILLDVRTAGERRLGVIPGVTEVALSVLDAWAIRRADSLDTPVVVHCQTGTRAVIGASLLRARGFTNVTPMIGGYEAWTSAGLPVETAPST